MKKVYIACSDPRESHEHILGVYATESDAYARVGKYHRENNTEEEMKIKELHEKAISDMTDEELGKLPLNQFSCIIGSVETHFVVDNC